MLIIWLLNLIKIYKNEIISRTLHEIKGDCDLRWLNDCEDDDDEE